MTTATIQTLTFGVEFECHLPEGSSREQAAAALRQRGIDCHAEGYNHNTRPAWKVVTDGSLGNYATGAEFVSPVLTGEAGLAEVERVCEALQDFGCTVNRSCGMHVHVGARNQPLAFFKKIVRLYQTYETVIDGLMPQSRRASNNGYCRSMRACPAATIEASASVDDISRALTRASGAGASRYHKVNLASMARHGTVEFRQHSGTLDGRKSRNWITTCLRMVATAARSDFSFGSEARTARNRARPGSKAHRVGEMLLRQGGTTGPEVCAELGWPSVSIPQQARACGLEVYTQRMGRTVRYYAAREEAASTQTAFDISLEGFCTLIGSSDSERVYMTARATNLSGPVGWAA